jgi:hypothetical protein
MAFAIIPSVVCGHLIPMYTLLVAVRTELFFFLSFTPTTYPIIQLSNRATCTVLQYR